MSIKEVGRAMLVGWGSAWLRAAVLVVVVSAPALWHFRADLRQSRDDERRDVANLTETLVEHASRSLAPVSQMLSGLGERLQAEGMTDLQRPRLERSIDAQLRTLSQVGEVIVLDNSGRRYVDSRADSLLSAGTLDALSIANRDGDRTGRVTAPRAEDRRAEVMAIVSRRIDRADGGFGGIVVATLSPDFFSKFYDRLDLGGSGTVTLVSLDGKLLLRRPFVAANVGRDLNGTALMDSVHGALSGTLPIVSPLDGTRRLLSFEVLPDNPLIVAASLADEDYLAGWRQEVIVEGGTLLLVLGAIVFLMVRNNRLELARRKTAENYRLLADHCGDMVLLKDRRGGTLYASPSCSRILGYPPEEMATMRAADVVHPDDLQKQIDLYARLSAENPVVMGQLRNRHKDGSIVWVEAVLKLVSSEGDGVIVLTVRDITARIAAEKSASEASARALTVLEATTDFVVAVDRDWRLTYLNQRAQDRWKEWDCSPGRLFWDVAPDALGTEFERVFRQVMATRVTLSVTAGLANDRWFEAQAAPSGEADGGIIIFYKDVTAAQRMRATLLAARDSAETMVQAKSQFLANMSHELRTPLNAVIGFAEMLERETLTPSNANRHREYAADIRQSGEHLLGLINEILDYSRAEAGHLPLLQEWFDPRAALESCVRMIAPRAARTGIAIDLHAEAAPDLFWADEKRVRQIVLNLLSNAVKFTPAGGRIDVDCSGADGLVVAVRDTGIGIAAADVERVMQAFTQVDNGQNRLMEGTGLGLPLSRRLAEMHGGALVIESVLGRGTTITLRLPPAVPAVEEVGADATPGVPDNYAPKPPVILFAEDDDLIRFNTAEMLRDYGYTVIEAKNSNEAIGCLQRADDVALLITDVVMPPGMDGLALARKARQLHPAIGIILASGYAPHLVAADADFHEFPVLEKPYPVNRLRQMIEEQLPVRAGIRAAA